jgi:hypothetical protein
LLLAFVGKLNEMPIFNEFCKNKQCPEYIEWTFDMGANCTSCKLVGQSYDITEYPKDCLFLDEIKKFESEQDSSTCH